VIINKNIMILLKLLKKLVPWIAIPIENITRLYVAQIILNSK